MYHQVELYIADTPCLLRFDDEGKILEVLANDDGGPNKGPRRISLTRELLKDIHTWARSMMNDVSAKTDTELREGSSESRVDPGEAPGTISG